MCRLFCASVLSRVSSCQSPNSSPTALVFTSCRSALPPSFHLPSDGTALVIFFSGSFLCLDACVLSLAPILGFGSHGASALVCFCSPESPSSTSCCFRASAPCAARSIALAHMKTTARVSSSFLFTTCSSGCGSVSVACSSSAVLGCCDVACQRSPQHYCVVLCHGVVAGPAPPCGSLPQRGLVFLRTGFSVVSLSLCFMC